jgi:DinB superfamily
MPGPPSPDPVAQAAEYVEHILGLLGEDDPAEAQATAPAAWRSLVAEAGDRLADRPEPTEWSVLECLGHAIDAEIVTSARYRWILAQEQPALIGYDQDLWVDRLRHRDDDANRLLALLDVLRGSNIELWRRSTDDDRQRFGVHAERGNESFDRLFRLIAGHDRFHLAQARRALEAVRV